MPNEKFVVTHQCPGRRLLHERAYYSGGVLHTRVVRRRRRQARTRVARSTCQGVRRAQTLLSALLYSSIAGKAEMSLTSPRTNRKKKCVRTGEPTRTRARLSLFLSLWRKRVTTLHRATVRFPRDRRRRIYRHTVFPCYNKIISKPFRANGRRRAHRPLIARASVLLTFAITRRITDDA